MRNAPPSLAAICGVRISRNCSVNDDDTSFVATCNDCHNASSTTSAAPLPTSTSITAVSQSSLLSGERSRPVTNDETADDDVANTSSMSRSSSGRLPSSSWATCSCFSVRRRRVPAIDVFNDSVLSSAPSRFGLASSSRSIASSSFGSLATSSETSTGALASSWPEAGAIASPSAC